MRRKAILLGFFSISGQVLLLREIVSSLHGNELFIGFGLFGWMLTVAMGAVGTRKLKFKKTAILFLIGAILLPVSLILTRLSPLLFADSPGQYISFAASMMIAMIVMLPNGIISGLLFTLITYEGHRPAASVARVYLYEGIGAFVGGVLIAFLVGSVFSTLELSIVISSLIFIGLIVFKDQPQVLYLLPVSIIILSYLYGNNLEKAIDQIKYKSYMVEESFDTRYTHQTILSRNETKVLMTDNNIERAYPNHYAVENLIIPPLLYHKNPVNILLFGLREFGIDELVDSITGLNLQSVDPRNQLTSEEKWVKDNKNTVLHQDAVGYFNPFKSEYLKYDIVIIDRSDFSNFKSARLIESDYFYKILFSLKAGGILSLPIDIDTDRHISFEKARLLTTIYKTLRNVFKQVHVWPGEMTLFFASDSANFGLPYETLVDRLSRLPIQPEFVNESYLFDRFEPIKIERLLKAVETDSTINSIDRPEIIHRQLALNATLSKTDRSLLSMFMSSRIMIPSIVAIILIVILYPMLLRQRRRYFALTIYFIAGLLSLSLELIIFYLYQSTVGSLYTDMAILIGLFMLGLAGGTYYSARLNKEYLEVPALLLMLSAVFFFYYSYENIYIFHLLYYSIFVFIIAVATGTLFVAATDRYYYGKSQANRGLGYAFEIVGSALGALVTTSVLLPIIGLQTLLISIIVIIIITLAGAMFTLNR